MPSARFVTRDELGREFEISREKDRDPKHEFVSVEARKTVPDAMKEPSAGTLYLTGRNVVL
jgi:hypothetical protein